MATELKARKVSKQLSKRYAGDKYANGFGVTPDTRNAEELTACIYLRKRAPKRHFPKEVDGVKVVTKVVGEFKLEA